ncbi:MAG TPA: hypothetical protein VLE74_00305 [Candidatus Saccharimonadales bacterium]|nr:hypothetical protein [Candidatus Saccharimonadales bacterium]
MSKQRANFRDGFSLRDPQAVVDATHGSVADILNDISARHRATEAARHQRNSRIVKIAARAGAVAVTLIAVGPRIYNTFVHTNEAKQPSKTELDAQADRYGSYTKVPRDPNAPITYTIHSGGPHDPDSATAVAGYFDPLRQHPELVDEIQGQMDTHPGADDTGLQVTISRNEVTNSHLPAPSDG